MKRSRPCLSRKMKKAMNFLEYDPLNGEIRIGFNIFARHRHYPRTKWVVRAERQFRRKVRELRKKDEAYERLKALLNETSY